MNFYKLKDIRDLEFFLNLDQIKYLDFSDYENFVKLRIGIGEPQYLSINISKDELINLKKVLEENRDE
jgi:hypothetical protein